MPRLDKNGRLNVVAMRAIYTLQLLWIVDCAVLSVCMVEDLQLQSGIVSCKCDTVSRQEWEGDLNGRRLQVDCHQTCNLWTAKDVNVQLNVDFHGWKCKCTFKCGLP